MDEALLEELVSDAEPEHLADLESLSPFLSEALLDKLVRRAPMGAPEEITTLAPFLSEDTLSFLVQRCETLSDYQLLNELLPFLNAQALDDLARRSFGNPEVLEQLAPFLSEESLDTVADLCLQSGNLQHLTPLFPFLGSRAMRKVAKALMAAGNLEALKEAAPFLLYTKTCRATVLQVLQRVEKVFSPRFRSKQALIEGEFASGCAHAVGAHLPDQSSKFQAHVLEF